MGEQVVGQCRCEMALELAAVVGEHGFDGKREHRLDQAEELGGGAGMTARGPGPGEVRVQVGAGNDVTPRVIGAQFDAVQGDAMAWTLA